MKKFADFWRGMFFLVSTVTVGIVLYLLVVVWQPLWTGGFDDFNKISAAIERLDQTTKPATALVPDMLAQMTEMNHNMRLMQATIHNMDQSIEHLDTSIQSMDQNMKRMDINIAQMKDVMTYQMGLMNYQVDKMNDKMSPMGMMPYNW